MAKNTLGIVIPQINNMELELDIVGRTPLLIKRFDEKTQQGIEDAQQKVAKQKKAPRVPEEEYQRARILNDKRQDCVRAIWFKKGMAAMGGYFGIPRGNIEQGVYVVGDLIPFKSDKPQMRTDRVRVGMGGMAKTSVTYRPEFANWSCRIRIGFDAEVLTAHQVVSLLAHAGGKNGIGEWRPQKGGDFGRFDVFPAGTSKALLAAEQKKPSRKRDIVQETEEMLEDTVPAKPAKKAPKTKATASKIVRRPKKAANGGDDNDLAAIFAGLSPEQRRRALNKLR